MLCKCCRVSSTGDAAGDGDTVKTEAGKLGIETGAKTRICQNGSTCYPPTRSRNSLSTEAWKLWFLDVFFVITMKNFQPPA